MLKSLKVLNGRRTTIHRFEASDISDSYVQWLNDPVVTRYSNQRFFRHTYDSCCDYLNSFETSDNVFLKICSIDPVTMIGTMTAYVSIPHRTVDIGIMIGDRSVWGNGYGQDAWNTFLQWLGSLPTVRKVTGGAIRSNIAMLRIMERSGMTLEAIRPGQQLLDGVPEDVLYFGRFLGDT